MAAIRKTIVGVAVAAATVVAAANIAWAQSTAPTGRHVTASLIVETLDLVPGQPLHLALREEIEPGWHTYWSNPGDSGLPTTIDWSLPQGFKAGAIMWPTPERFAYGPVVDYGYQHEVLLRVTIKAPASLQPGLDLTLLAHASWLVCSDTCIPEDVNLSISIPVAGTSEPDPRWTQVFVASRARTPVPNPFPTQLSVSADKLALHVAMGDASQLRDVTFFPADAQVIDDDAPQVVNGDSQGLVLTLARDTSKPPPTALNGVLVFRDLAAQAGGAPDAIEISAAAGTPTSGPASGLGLLAALLLALAGGIVLNLMPCVLPVLAIKAFGLVQHAQSAPREVRLQGLAYAAGVLISFALIAGALIGLRAAGAEIGWGFQLQSPLFVAAMIYVLFAVGLNLSGVFTFGAAMTGVGGNLASIEGYAGSFLTGALATLVATPCTAPFMAAALGYALTQPWYASLAVFEAVGLGLALPYLAIAFSPSARRFLPKPGAWMLRLKEVLAFPVYGTAVWLMFVLSTEAGAEAATAALAGLVLIAFTAWLYEAVRASAGRWRGFGTGIAALSAAGALALLLATASDLSPSAGSADEAGLGWQPFSAAKIEELRTQGTPIFVDVTAAWCITCKVNERVALADTAVRKAFADGGVVAVKADWTRQDAAITRVLEANGRAGVPLYLFYPKPHAVGTEPAPVVLPQILTPETVLAVIRGE